MLWPGARAQKEFIVSTKLMTTKVMFFSKQLQTRPRVSLMLNELLYTLHCASGMKKIDWLLNVISYVDFDTDQNSFDCVTFGCRC